MFCGFMEKEVAVHTTMIFTLLSPIIFSHFLQNRAFSAISFVHSLQNRAFYVISNFLHDYFAFTFSIFVYLLIRNFLHYEN